MTLNALVPQWLRKTEDDMRDWSVPTELPIATLPEFNSHDEETMVMQRAAALHVQLRRSIEAAQIELAEAVLGRQGDQQKIGFLEKENAELRLEIAQLQNTVATLQSDVEERRRFESMIKEINDKTARVLDRFGAKAPPKKERKPKALKLEAVPAEFAPGA